MVRSSLRLILSMRGDVVAIEIPDEAPHETLKPIPFDLDIVYEG